MALCHTLNAVRKNLDVHHHTIIIIIIFFFFFGFVFNAFTNYATMMPKKKKIDINSISGFNGAY